MAKKKNIKEDDEIAIHCRYDKLIEPAKLKPHPANPSRHPEQQVKLLADIIRTHGVRWPITVSNQSGFIVSGHCRRESAMLLGMKGYPVTYQDFESEAEELAVLVADNNIAELSEIDGLKMADVIVELDQVNYPLELTAIPKEQIDDYICGPGLQEAQTKDNILPSMTKKVISKEGDFWQLGEHRLLCGDSRRKEIFTKLLANRKAQLCVTSPPYGVGKAYEEKGIEAWFECVQPTISNLAHWCKVIVWQIGDLYSTNSQFIEPTFSHSITMFSEVGLFPLWIRIWLKPGSNYGVGPYHLITNKPVQQYEHIIALAETPIEELEINIDQYEWILGFAGLDFEYVKRLSKKDRRQWGYSGVWAIKTVPRNDIHPAMFPIELPIRCIKLHSSKNGIIVDPYLGSGSTLIACEKTERKCYGIEIEPKYCDVIVKRWEDFTGKKAKLLK